MFKKNKVAIMLFLLMIIPIRVDAVKLRMGDNICYNKTTGVYQSGTCSDNYTTYKYFEINGQNVLAYCAQLPHPIVGNDNEVNYTIASNPFFSNTSQESFIAGRVIELTKERYNDPKEQFLYATELINYIFKLSDNKDFVSDNSNLTAIYNEAKLYATKSVNTSTQLPKPTFTVEGNDTDMSSSATGNTYTYLSKKITLSNLKDNYGLGVGTNNGDVTYTVSVAGTGTVSICNDAKGTQCQSSLSFSKQATDVSFYVKSVTNDKNGGEVTIKVKGSNRSTYTIVDQYNSEHANDQILMVPRTNDYPRSVENNFHLTMPSLSESSHVIMVRKLDEDNGDYLSGAEFVLFKTNKNDRTCTKVGDNLASNSNGNFVLKWKKSFTVTDSSTDDFYDFDYCVQETKSPSGYRLLTSPLYFSVRKSSDSYRSCYDESGNVVDINYCEAKYGNCPDGYSESENRGICVKKEEKDSEKQMGCSSGSEEVVVDGNHMCKSEGNAPSVNSETGESVCEDGFTLEGEKCFAYSSLVVLSQDCSDEDKAAGYSFSDGKCSVTRTIDRLCTNDKSENIDSQYCSSNKLYMTVNQTGNNLNIDLYNKKTSVSISKKSVSGEEEIPGAKLRICSTKPDANGNCEVAKLTQKGISCPIFSDPLGETTDSSCQYDATNNQRVIELSWISSDVPVTWEGLEVGKNYYLVEDTPPKGYKSITTSIEFMILEDGQIKAGDKEVPNNLLVVNNELNGVTISKQDIVTSKEIPGATLSICESYKGTDGKIEISINNEGECSLVTLADGSSAIWVSGDKPHEIHGLPAGTYFLVEKIAPKGYTIANKILFTMSEDGKITDASGKSLKNNKIVMYDEVIPNVPTGSLMTYVALCVLLLSEVGGVGSYIFLNKKKNNFV